MNFSALKEIFKQKLKWPGLIESGLVFFVIVWVLFFLLQDSFISLFAKFFDQAKLEFVFSMTFINLLIVIFLFLIILIVKHKLNWLRFEPETRKFVLILFLILFAFFGIVFYSDFAFKLQIIERSQDIKWHTYLMLPLSMEHDLLTVLENSLSASELSKVHSTLPVYNFYIKDKYIAELNADLPFSGAKNVNGFFQVNDNNYFAAEFRYRGDNYYHWGSVNKSWRIKLENHQLLDGVNKFNLINPKHTSHMILPFTSYIQEALGVLGARSYLSALYINNNYAGVYEYVDQLDESFLRLKNLLPCDIYSGDKPRDDQEWITREQQGWLVFDDSGRWELTATFDGDENRAMKNIDFFLENVNTQDVNRFYEFFQQYLGEPYLNFLAEKTIINDFHTDDRHNHKFYFDPSSGQFIPIAWDQVVEKISNDWPVDMMANRIDRQILQFPELIFRKNKLIFAHLNSFTLANALDIIDGMEQNLVEPIKSDIYKDVMNWPLSRNITFDEWKIGVNDLRETIKFNYEYIRKKFDEVDLQVSLVNLGNNLGQLIVDVNGVSAIRIKDPSENCLQVRRSFIPESEKICLGQGSASDLFYSGRKISTEKIILNNLERDVNAIGVVPMRYVFDIDYKTAKSQVQNLKFYNAITDAEVFPNFDLTGTAQESAQYLVSGFSKHPWLYDDFSEKTVVWTGEVVVETKQVFKKNEVLKIQPGTKILLKNGAAIVSFGKIIALGTPEAPIVFNALDENSVWGAVALQGMNSSLDFNWVHMSGGSGISHNSVNYTGMLSVYNGSAQITNSYFADNKITDDMFNAKNAVISIKDSEFRNALSDAIDLDISDGEIIRVTVSNTGGDAIDLMTSSVHIDGVSIMNAGDKGISIGEKSNPIIQNTLIQDSNTGIAIKDRSNPKISSLSLRSNNSAIAAYPKNWRYGGGGLGEISDSDFCENKSVLFIEPDSQIIFLKNDTRIVCMDSNCNIGCGL
ncbi:MAG: CotH kinase family protein [Candidatus Diapherotrites archaeon]|nr:CotH kinase family protein [Candidatus Diapherotrites archaeon]